MLKYNWQMTTIRNSQDFSLLKNLVTEIKPTIGAVDTETDGLHIVNCKPFVIQFGFLDPKNLKGYTFAIDLENCPIADEVLTYWDSVAHTLKAYMGHNIKFDLHMLANIGHEYIDDNLTDTTFWIRYGHDSLHQEEGGPMLGLKEYATKYIDREAKLHERKLDKEKTELVKKYNNRLKTMLNTANIPKPAGQRSFTLSVITDMFKDCIFEANDLPEDIREIYFQWLQSLPLYLQNKVTNLVEKDMIRYNDLDRENLLKYAHYDIVYTLEIFESLYNIVLNREQQEGIKIENQCLIPWYQMERTGFKADKEYLEKCRQSLKDYIISQRQNLYKITHQQFTVGQHATIKDILKNKYGLEVKSTGNEALDLIKPQLEGEVLEVINLIQELRTLEKWYSVYILRFQKDLRNNDRLYANINSVGAVSGRVTSDFQQFPKKGIKDRNGNELFHPRRIVISDSGIVYLDYSQIELRFQALYTILVDNPDFNMCRAYMPYHCYRLSDVDYIKEDFDENNPEHIKHYNDFIWYHKEDNKEWEPVDVHGATTTAATGLTKEDPEFSSLRSKIGKRVNFAKNYGAQLSKIKEMFPEKTHEECVVINDAYYKAFPGIKKYHEYCSQMAAHYSNTPNLFGVKYYNVSGHKLKNMLIQGSAAFFLKKKIIELYKYCKDNNIKSKLQMQIHDELSWEYNPEDPPEIFFKFKEIMEDWRDTKVPIIADMEATNNSWADKKDVTTIDELKGVINND